ncbi:alpha/beta fold hydrolase [Gordonia rhizosphera]|uniref:Putative hydrolase n=1 Tax=Gordonia rhizosphera NBRC 16068 TaxID=1108045 RepID=K6W540_9ACTN|nr:alpha/beta hydrolase [Gordonia rhizosphera]GAB88791.1 putative hydrolase [Gordonia rhizosphera NBRC 16068]
MTQPQPAAQTITLPDGTSLETAQYGEGEPLLLICGTSQPHELWAPIVPALAAEYRVITYNHRGIGGSERGTGPLSMRSLAEDAHEVLRQLGIAKAHVLGWSLGSTVAQELAIAHPDAVGAVALAATWGRTNVFQTAVFTGLAHPWRTGDRLAALTALGIAYSPELLETPDFAGMMAALEPLFPSSPTAMATVAEQWDADLAHDAIDRLEQITAPTLVIAGENDLLTPAAQGRMVAERIPTARLEVFTGSGSSHAMLMELPDKFTALVAEHLAKHPIAS